MQPSLAASQGRSGGMGPPSSTLNKSAGASSALHKSNGASSMIGQSFMSTKINLPGNAGGPLRPTQPTTKPFGANGGNAPHAAIEQQPKPAPAPAPEPEVYQELPDIDSEYSDSDDEAAQEKKQAAMPGWAKSPNLVRALQQQQEINPDDIFGPIPKLSIGGASKAFSPVCMSRLAESDDVRSFDRDVSERHKYGSAPPADLVRPVGRDGRAHADRYRAVSQGYGFPEPDAVERSAGRPVAVLRSSGDLEPFSFFRLFSVFPLPFVI